MNLLQRLLGRSDVYFGGSVYMRRWKFLPEWMPGFRVHNIVRSDVDRELHDHPFTFVSIILCGGYFEHTADGKRTWYGVGSVVVRSAETFHRLELPEGSTAWTLVFRGRYRRVWGFLTPHGWQDWRAFIAERYDVPKRDRPFAAGSSL